MNESIIEEYIMHTYNDGKQENICQYGFVYLSC